MGMERPLSGCCNNVSTLDDVAVGKAQVVSFCCGVSEEEISQRAGQREKIACTHKSVMAKAGRTGQRVLVVW